MDWLMNILIFWLGPIAAGFGFNWIANKSRGRNARSAFKCAAWGSWLLLLGHFCFWPLPFFWVINLLIWLTPSAICYLLAANHMLKEMRAQKEGEFTDAA
jgi:hypothetical protein